MAVAQDDLLRCVWKFKVDGLATRGLNTYYFKVEDLVSAVDEDISADFDGAITNYYDQIIAQLSSDYAAESLRITNISKKEFVGDAVPAFVGTGAAGASSPGQVAVEVLGRARKLGHIARKYLGPVIEAVHDDGVLTAGALIAFNLFRDKYVLQFVGGVTTNTYTPVMVKFLAGGGVGGFEEIDEDLGVVIPTARTQRSRTPGVGLT